MTQFYIFRSKAAGADPGDVQRPKISLLLKMFMKAGVVKSEIERFQLVFSSIGVLLEIRQSAGQKPAFLFLVVFP
jgi:hypothetical protein